MDVLELVMTLGNIREKLASLIEFKKKYNRSVALLKEEGGYTSYTVTLRPSTPC